MKTARINKVTKQELALFARATAMEHIESAEHFYANRDADDTTRFHHLEAKDIAQSWGAAVEKGRLSKRILFSAAAAHYVLAEAKGHAMNWLSAFPERFPHYLAARKAEKESDATAVQALAQGFEQHRTVRAICRIDKAWKTLGSVTMQLSQPGNRGGNRYEITLDADTLRTMLAEVMVSGDYKR